VQKKSRGGNVLFPERFWRKLAINPRPRSCDKFRNVAGGAPVDLNTLNLPRSLYVPWDHQGRRGGADSARMKLANNSTSVPNVAGVFGLRLVVHRVSEEGIVISAKGM
jgi:hypothetical protein